VAVDGARDQFLADAALAADQHRRIGSRDAPDELQKVADLRGGADEVVAGLQPVHIALERDVATLETLPLHRLLEDRLELAELAGLGEEVLRALLHGADRLLHRAVGGEHDHRGRGGQFLDLAQQVDAAAVGQPHIEQHDVEHLLCEQLSRSLQVAGRLDRITRASQLPADQRAEGLLVVHQQQKRFRHRCLLSLRSAVQR
jgi:hypothetical protein